MDLFETRKVDSGTTGLVDDWRLKLAPPSNATSPGPSTIHTSTSSEHEHHMSPESPMLVSVGEFSVRPVFRPVSRSY